MNTYYTSVIIAAAGKGSRMTTTKDKLFADLCGKTVIERTLSAFQNAESVNEIIVVTSPHSITKIKDIVSICGLSKVTAIIEGASTRAESVAKGIAALSPLSQFISIHDGARPFITSSEIDRIHNVAYKKKAVCCGTPVTDTVKKISNNGAMEETIDRNTLFAAQTPQIFKKDIYIDAISKAGDKISRFTDDSSIVEAAGYTVYAEFTKTYNIKITTEPDLVIGKAIFNEGI